MIAVAANGCDAVHPGYGFLSENVDSRARLRDGWPDFVGPIAAALELFGDKVKARALAEQCGVPVIAGTNGATSLEEVRAFMESLGPGGAIMIKAVAGGGGRGMRAVEDRRNSKKPTHAPIRSSGGIRRGRLRRAAHSRCATHRGADRRRPPRRDHRNRRARMHDPAPQPEAHRDRAESFADARATRRASSRRQKLGRGSALPQSRHVRVPASMLRRQSDVSAIRLHRSKPAAAGRAYNYRRNLRHRSRAVQLRIAGGRRLPLRPYAEDDP